MIIFAKGLPWFDFWKMIIFDSFLISFSSSFLKNERKMKTKNELKMAWKWLPWTTLFGPMLCRLAHLCQILVHGSGQPTVSHHISAPASGETCNCGLLQLQDRGVYRKRAQWHWSPPWHAWQMSCLTPRQAPLSWPGLLGTGHYEWVTWWQEAGYACTCRMQVGQTWLQLCGGGELCLPHCIMSIMSEMDTEHVYDNQT